MENSEIRWFEHARRLRAGQGVVALQECCEASALAQRDLPPGTAAQPQEVEVAFSVVLSHQGVPCGELVGRIALMQYSAT